MIQSYGPIPNGSKTQSFPYQVLALIPVCIQSITTASGPIEAHQAWNVIAERSPGALQQICWSFNMTPPYWGLLDPQDPPAKRVNSNFQKNGYYIKLSLV